MTQALAQGLDAESLELTLKSLHEFSQTVITEERILDLDARDEFPEDIVRALGSELGIQLLFVPEAYGGMGGDAIDIYRVCEAMARIDLGIATGVLATFLGSDPILAGGTPDQKAQWLGKIAAEGILFAYGATEPEAGSDLAALRTTAEPVVVDGQTIGYKLNGAKQWISNGGVADATTILANAPGGPTWFIVERETPGFTHGKPEDKHGIRLSNTAALSLADVFVPTDRLVGGIEGQGLAQAQKVFGYTRLMVAAFGLGGGWAALDRAIAYSQTRIQAGTPLSEKQGYTHKLIVPNVVRLEAGRAFIEATAERLCSGGEDLNTEGAIAKYIATEAGNLAADSAIQALGGYGYTREYMVEKFKRDVRITTIYEGTSEIMEMTISRDRWQQHLKTRGRHYHDEAARFENLHGQNPNVGANVVALALHALAEVLERSRVARLTRHQHILFRLGELIAVAESAGALAERAARHAGRGLNPKCDARFDAPTLAAISRMYARDAATKIVQDGIRLVIGTGSDQPIDFVGFETALNVSAVHRSSAGNLADAEVIRDAVYGKKAG